MEPDFPQEVYMTRYLFEVKYTVAGLQGLLKEGGSKRMEATQALAKSVGGRIKSLILPLGRRIYTSLAKCRITPAHLR